MRRFTVILGHEVGGFGTDRAREVRDKPVVFLGQQGQCCQHRQRRDLSISKSLLSGYNEDDECIAWQI